MFRVLGERTHPEPTRRKKGTMINTTNRKIDKKRRKKKDKRRRKPKAPPRNHQNPPTKRNRSFPLVFIWGGGWLGGFWGFGGFGVSSSCLSSLFCSWGFWAFLLVFLLYSSCCFVFLVLVSWLLGVFYSFVFLSVCLPVFLVCFVLILLMYRF